MLYNASFAIILLLLLYYTVKFFAIFTIRFFYLGVFFSAPIQAPRHLLQLPSLRTCFSRFSNISKKLSKNTKFFLHNYNSFPYCLWWSKKIKIKYLQFQMMLQLF